MKDTEQRTAAKQFAEYWKDKGYEKGESQPFWLSLLRDIFGTEHPEQTILFEEQVHIDHTSFIDGYIPATHVLIEQKGKNKDLRKAIKQSDGSIDYLNFLYFLFATTDNAPKDVPLSIAMQATFEALYTVIQLYISKILYKLFHEQTMMI